MSMLMSTSGINHPEGTEEVHRLAALLAQFGRLTDQIRERVLQEEFDRANDMLEERGALVETMQRLIKPEEAGKKGGTEEHQRCGELIVEVHTSSRRLADAIEEKHSVLVERLVEIQNMKSSQAYTKRGTGYGYRQGNK